MGAGFPINWADPKDGQFRFHPLYIKYSSKPFSQILATEVKADLNAVVATADSAKVCAYLSWLLRTKELLA